MKRAVLWRLGVSVLLGFILYPAAASSQGSGPSGEIAYIGEQRPPDFHGRGRATFTALKVGQSARAAGMGDAFTAVADDINAIFWNAAGLTHIERFEYALGYTHWMVGSKFFSGAAAWRYGQQTFGVSLIQFDGGSAPETTPLQPDGTGREFSTGDTFLKAAYAYKITDRLSMGISAKWIQERLDQDRMNSVSFDFSTLFYTGFGSSRIAMTLHNFGKDHEPNIPGSLTFGFAKVSQPMVYTIAFALEPVGKKGDPHYVTTAAELTHHIDDRERAHFGAELWLANTLALRAGYRWRYDLGNWAIGAGVQRDLGSGRRIGVDFSYADFGNLFDAPLRVSLTGAF